MFKRQICYTLRYMFENSIVGLSALSNSCVKIHTAPDSNSSVSVTIQNETHVHMNFFFSKWRLLSPLKLLTCSPESSCI